MICRLCLIDLYSEISVPLFNDFGNSDGPELVKIILKYLHIDITSADEISTAICHECSKHLKEFDEYCACVKKQQIMLSQTALLGEANAENIADATLSVEPMEVEVKCELGCLTMESQLKCEPEETVVTEQELISGLIRTSSSYSVSSSSSFLHEANTSGSAQIVNPQKIDDSSPSLDNHVHTLPDANTIRLFQPIQKIYKNYLMGISLKDKDRIQISKAVIDEYLKDAPEKLVHQEEFKKLAETIKEVFPSELVSMYYIPSIGHQQASGKLYNAYNNKINALKASRELNIRSKACVSTDVTPVDVSPPKRQKRSGLPKKIILKENVARGKEHKTASGNVVPAKLFQVQETCRCGKNCGKKINVCRQKDIFESYYSGSWTQKTLLMHSLIKKKNVSSTISEDGSIKRSSYEYSFIDDKGTSQKVCQVFFITCLNISRKRIQNAVKSLLSNPNALEKRGVRPPAIKTPEEDRLNVISFINLFPKYESH